MSRLSMTRPRKKVSRWTYPRWLIPYARYINTSGHQLEDIMNDDGKTSNTDINAPMALICVSVKSQVGLLIRLYHEGIIK